MLYCRIWCNFSTLQKFLGNIPILIHSHRKKSSQRDTIDQDRSGKGLIDIQKTYTQGQITTDVCKSTVIIISLI